MKSFIKRFCEALAVSVVMMAAVSPVRSQNADSLNWAVLYKNLDSTRRSVYSMSEDDPNRLPGLHYIARYCYDLDSAKKYCTLLLDLAIKSIINKYLSSIAVYSKKIGTFAILGGNASSYKESAASSLRIVVVNKHFCAFAVYS